MLDVRRVLIIVFDGVQLLDAAGPIDVFDAASKLTDGGYRIEVATPEGADVRAESGLRLGADVALEQARGRLDTLLVAGGFGTRMAALDPAIVGHIARLARGARRVTSVCTGAELLARAGVLRGRRVTTHWAWCDQLAEDHPDLVVERDRIYVRDGNVATSAGVSAGMDLALALVEEDHGAAIARTVAQLLVLFLQRPGGQSQFSTRLAPPVPRSAALKEVLGAIFAQPASDHRVEALARRAAMSERHLTRRFAQELQTTPARFVERVRVEAARATLESGSTVDAAARRSGFESTEVMRRAFHRTLGVSPSEYRDRFTTSIAALEPAWSSPSPATRT
jgi:transcriptional regulator GlxA family with amidase domain